MLTPDIAIMSVGTEITYGNSMVPDDGWVEILNQKWNKSIVLEETSKYPELTLQVQTLYSLSPSLGIKLTHALYLYMLIVCLNLEKNDMKNYFNFFWYRKFSVTVIF